MITYKFIVGSVAANKGVTIILNGVWAFTDGENATKKTYPKVTSGRKTNGREVLHIARCFNREPDKLTGGKGETLKF